jgi:hypothetical protein
MASSSETKEQVEREAARRGRLAAPAIAGGVLYLLSGIIIASTISGAPSVGLLQGLAPALRGEARPVESPRAAEVKFFSHHAFALIAGSVLVAVALAALVLILLLLLDAARFRRPQTFSAARPLILFGGIALALVSVGHQIVGAIETHNFAVGHDFSNHAVDNALTKGTPYLVIDYLDLVAGLALAAGVIVTALAAMRVGLLTRWMGVLGIFTGVLIFLPLGGVQLEIIPAFWMVMIGILFGGRWPNGDPPAWASGEARPWPSGQEVREARRARAGQPALSAAGANGGNVADVAPEPARPATSSSARRRRRKRGTRR